MTQLAGLKSEKDMLIEIEKELYNYKFYYDLLNLLNENDINLGNMISQKIIIVKLIENFIQRLPEHLQEFIASRYIDGYTIERVAEKIGVTTRTCYRYRLQVLCKLKIFFEHQKATHI